MKYKIDYGYGQATLYTPYIDDVENRFYTLANTCFGIRKSIEQCLILSKSESNCEDFERLEFNGDVYVWRKDGARKMLRPFESEEWDTYYCEEVAKRTNDGQNKDRKATK